MKSSNRQQRNYIAAKAMHEYYKALSEKVEQEYIAKNGITNPDGSTPEKVWMIDDQEVFDKANEDCFRIAEEFGLIDKLDRARADLRAAENALIAYGLSIMPDSMRSERETLERAAASNIAARNKLIDYTMKLDVRTVSV